MSLKENKPAAVDIMVKTNGKEAVVEQEKNTDAAERLKIYQNM